MKKLQTKNWILTGILLLSISSLAMLIPNALAQDASTVTINATVEDGCDWTGDPYLSTSSLDVWDEEICVIQGTGREALNVNVHEDGVISGGGGSLGGVRAGGKLIVGSISDDTDFTMYGTVNFDGIVNVGNGTTHEYDATLATHSTNSNNVGVSNTSTRSDGILTVIYNGTDNAGNTADNTVNFVNSQLNMGNTIGVTTGIFTHNDDTTTSYINSGRVEGGALSAFNNLQGTLTINQSLEIRDTSIGNNSGIINMTNGGFRLGASTESPTFTNALSGVMNQPNANWFEIQGSFTNLGTVTANRVVVMGNATVNNNGGAFDTSVAGGIFAIYDDDSDGTVSVFNNNTGGTIDTEQTWIIAGTYTTTGKAIFNNMDGGTFTADSMNFGFSDAGASLPETGGNPIFFGAIFNNYSDYNGTDGGVHVAGATGVNMFRGSKFNNNANGTIDISAGSVQMGTDFDNGTPADDTDDGQCLSAGDADSCKITNISTIDNVNFDSAFDIAGSVNMYEYSNFNNNGNMLISGSNNIDIIETNTTVINGVNGDLTLAGGNETFELGVAVDNDGIISATGPSIIFEDTASLDNAVGATLILSGGGADLTLNDTSNIANAGIITVADTTRLYDSPTITQTEGDFNTNYLHLIDTTSAEATFTISGGTVDVALYTYVYDGGTVNNNVINIEGTPSGGKLTTGGLRIGEDGSTNGGIINIDELGELETTGASSNNYINKGILDIKTTSTATTPLTTIRRLYIRGDATESAYLYMRGSGTTELIDVRVYEYGNYYANDGVTDLNSTNFALYGTALSQGLLYIALGAEVNGVNTLNMGYSTIRGGKIENYGTLQRGPTATLFINMYNAATIYNGSGGLIDAYTGGITMQANEDFPTYAAYSYVENDTGGTLEMDDLLTNNTGQVIDNSGTFNLTYRGFLGQTNGGTINNYDTFNITNRLEILNAATFNNEEDAIVNGPGELTIEGATAAFYQKEGTDAGAQVAKVDVSKIAIGDSAGTTNGFFENADYIRTDILDVYLNGTFNGVLDATGDPSPDDAQDSITFVDAGGGAEVKGGTSELIPGLLIEGSATDQATLQIAEPFDIGAAGIVTIDGVLDLQGINSDLFETYGQFYSGNYSDITLAAAPGIKTYTGSFTEIAGTLVATSIEMVGGDMCMGDWTGGTYPTGSCTNNALDPSKTISGSGTAFDVGGDANVDAHNDLTLQNGDLNINEASTFESYGTTPVIDVQNNANVIITDQYSSLYTEGRLDIQGSGIGNHGYIQVINRAGGEIAGTTNDIGSIWMAGGSDNITSLTIASSATVNLNDTHIDSLKTGVITTGLTDVTGDELIAINGTVNMNSGGTQHIHLGVDSPTNWGIDGVQIFSGGSLQHTNSSIGNLDINDTGVFYIADDSNADLDADINGETYIGGRFDHLNEHHGAFIDGQFQCQTKLVVESDGLMDVGLDGDVTVAGSTTDVYGDVELDGTLNAGNLTVYSGGIISSGDGTAIGTAQGCGPSGQFGCGTGTNFYINATTLDVQSGGKISSDGVSEQDRDNITIAHGGSYGGEGVANGTPDTTHDAAKASSPLYGDQGEEATDYFTGHGGGGVNIDVTGTDGTANGTITINGTVSADAGLATYDLKYEFLTSNFEIGAILTGGTSGAKGAIIADDAIDTLTLTQIEGESIDFTDGEIITDDTDLIAPGSANVKSGTDEVINDATGAGGTIIISQTPFDTGATFTGSGSITANGTSDSGVAYPGGGGRIVIDSILFDDPDDSCGATHPHYLFTGDIEAKGGDDTTNYAAAGTIAYLGDINNPNDTLIVDQDGAASDTGTQAPVSSYGTDPVTRVAASGDYIFARVEARDAAVITYETNPATNPTSCFDADGGSTITGPTCGPIPDKPDTMNLADNATGAQSGCGATEPSTDNPVTGLFTLEPVFSFVYRNPEDSSTVDKLQIQVDDNADFSSTLWDATLTGLTQDDESAITPGDRTEDIPYGGTTLSTSTTYYVRAAFYDTTGATQGLWTHYDIGSYYQFEVDGSMTISDGCTSSIDLKKDGLGVDDPSTSSGNRYAEESCTMTVTSDQAAWSLLFGMAPGETAFDNAGQTANIDPIASPTDCNLTTDGTGSEEEYGFNVGTTTAPITGSVQTDTAECNQAFNNWTLGTGDYVFDVESAGSEDEIVRITTGGTTAGSTFDIHMRSTVNSSTAADDYDLDVRAIITTNP